MAKLTALEVKRMSAPGRYGDGGGLWLQVRDAERKSWLLRFMLNGKAREMGLGPIELVSLAEARQKAIAGRKLLLDGIDPLDQRKAEKAARVAQAGAFTFKEVAEKYIKAHKAGWKSEKHAAQWEATLTTYAYPHFGAHLVSAVDTGDVTKALEPIWATKPETASRVRGRIESVLDYAKSRGWRQGENPARWKGHLDNLLPKRSKVARVEHHAALPWREIGAFMAKLGEQAGMAALALRFAILTAGRTGEVIGARWSEIDIEAALWTVPADRMKAAREHRVPLSSAALAMLGELLPLRPQDGDGYVFPGGKAGKPLSNMALLMALRRMERGDLTAHGFRSTFRDWCAEATAYPAEMAEMALAHAVGSKVEAAYRRGDLFEKRREMMKEWAEFCGGPVAPSGAERVPIRPAIPA